jgi:hypothetical protein
MGTHELRPMGIGDILDTTFRLYRQRFLTFLLIALIVYVPYAILLALFQPFQMAQTPVNQQQVPFQQRQTEQVLQGQVQQPPIMAANPVGAVLGIIGFFVFAVVLLPLCSAAMVHNISGSYLGESLTAGQSYARAAPSLLGLVGTQFLVTLAIIGGCFLCIVPGIIFSLWFLVVMPVVILESKAGPTAMKRSRELMRGNVNKGFILAFAVGVLSFIVAWSLGKLTVLVPLPHPAIGVFFSIVLQSLILPIQTAPWILLYYDLRIRKEAFDLERLADALGQVAAT